MITEDYVSYEVAKLLREKGFDEPLFEFYVGNENTIRYARNKEGFRLSELKGDFYYPHITHQMAMKWLREVHNIIIQIELYSKHGDYCFEVFKNTHRMIVEKDEVYNSYEEACEAGIKYCLINLIK